MVRVSEITNWEFMFFDLDFVFEFSDLVVWRMYSVFAVGFASGGLHLRSNLEGTYSIITGLFGLDSEATPNHIPHDTSSKNSQRKKNNNFSTNTQRGNKKTKKKMRNNNQLTTLLPTHNNKHETLTKKKTKNKIKTHHATVTSFGALMYISPLSPKSSLLPRFNCLLPHHQTFNSVSFYLTEET